MFPLPQIIGKETPVDNVKKQFCISICTQVFFMNTENERREIEHAFEKATLVLVARGVSGSFTC